MAVAFVGATLGSVVGTGAGNGATTNSVTHTPTAGNFLVCAYCWNQNGNATTGTLDSGFTKSVETVGGASFGVGLWYHANIAGSALTVTLTTTNATDSVMAIVEYSGVATSSPADPASGVGAFFADTGNAAKSSGNITSVGTTDLVVGVYGDWGINAAIPAPSDSKTSRTSLGSSTVVQLNVVDLLTAAGATNSSSFTIPLYGATQDYAIVVGGYKPAAGAVVLPPPDQHRRPDPWHAARNWMAIR